MRQAGKVDLLHSTKPDPIALTYRQLRHFAPSCLTDGVGGNLQSHPMRIIKLSKFDTVFRTAADVISFFEKDLYRRSPKGAFRVTPRKQHMHDLAKGSLLLFSYQTQCMFIGRAQGAIQKDDPMDKFFDPKWPAQFVIDMKSVFPVTGSLHSYEKALRKKTGFSNSIVQTREWPSIPDKYEKFTLHYFGAKSTKQHALDDQAPPRGNENPDRALSSHWTYHRDPVVRKYVLGRARGRCEYCGKHGFLLPSGHRFLETHHVISLAKEGADTPRNVIALCPNHH